MRYFPLFMDLAGRACLVVGAGAVAARKARALLECGARVTVVGERPAAAFRALERRGVRCCRGASVPATWRQALVIAATDDRAVNAAVSAAARRRGIPVNAVDDPEHCTFIVPAVVRRGDLKRVALTGGKSPAAARLVKERIAAMLGDEYAALVRLLGAHRGRMKAEVAGQGARGRAWKRMIAGGVLESLRQGDRAGAASTVRRCLDEAARQRDSDEIDTCRRLAGRRGGAKRGTPVARTEGSTAEVRSAGPRSPTGTPTHHGGSACPRARSTSSARGPATPGC